jgi:SAM-dependent methyltransferase
MTTEEQDNPIEGLGEDLRAVGKSTRWEQFRLPVELSGKTFLDVGCWEGVHCADAIRRGAEGVTGVDICTCPDLTTNVERYGFEFLQMDVFGEHWLGLDRFDVVLCSGLIYHVPDPMALLMRLRPVTAELLVIETASTSLGGEEPMMMFQGDDAGNASNWWIPNRACVEQMLTTAGFAGISTVWEEAREDHWGRLCVHAVPSGTVDRGRLLPRKPRLMSVRGGNRGGKGGKGKRAADS